jgi:hypothetical protein
MALQSRTNDHILRYEQDQQEITLHIAQYERDRQVLLDEAKSQEARRKREQHLEVAAWLRTPEFGEQERNRHGNLQQARLPYPDTGLWLLKVNKVWNWLSLEEPPHALLWIHGKHGMGKCEPTLCYPQDAS